MRIVWHQEPDKELARICRELEKIRISDGQDAYWALVRELLLTDPWFLFRVALQWDFLDEDLIGRDLIRHYAEHRDSDIALLLPRGHGKTIPVSGLMVFEILRNPEIAILQVSRTDDNAEKIGVFISDILTSNDYLQRCFGKAHSEGGFLPATEKESRSWGKDGYTLPYRKRSRIDPTLLNISIASAKAGKHPDLIWVDDPTEEENNDPAGWEKVETFIKGCKMLLPSSGKFIWTGTRWHDADPLGKVEKGKILGQQGRFHVLKRSCYIDDDPQKGPIYPQKKRWGSSHVSGYSIQGLEEKRGPESEGGLGAFFDAQMRNDPIPLERADIKVSDVNIYDSTDAPELSEVRLFGIETTGGGLPIFNGFKEHIERLKIPVPLLEITNPRKVGTEKRDRILAALQPLASSGRLYAQQWMIGDGSESDGLGYEIRRLGKAQHDDIIDALHNVPAHLSKGITPQRDSAPADLYISVDLAWSEKKRADWTVVMAVAVDKDGNHWVIDYERFQVASPTGIYDRLLEFYQKYQDGATRVNARRKKYVGAWR